MGIGEYAGVLPPGTAVGDYRIERVIWRPGHFGITYVATDALGNSVALKEYFPVEIAVREGDDVRLRRAEDAGIFKWGLRGFLEECEHLVYFNNSSVARGYKAFELNGTGYFAMEYVDGESLGDLLQREGRMGEARLRSFLMPVVDGVRHAHEAGLLHRDICPADIRIAADGRPVLTDFAGARNVLRFKSKSVAHAFTAGYAPPEEYQVTGKQGAWTDVYSLAAVAYRAVTGQAPLDAPARVKGTRLAPAAEVAAGRYPDDFLRAIDWGLRLDSAERPQRVADWQAALDGEMPVPVFDVPASAEPDASPTPVPASAPAAQSSTPAVAIAAAPAADSPFGVDAPAPPARRVPVWAIAAAAGVIVIALAGYALSRRSPPPTAPVPVAVTPVESAAPAVPEPSTATASAPADTEPEELGSLERIALQLMQQDQRAKEDEAAAEVLKAKEDEDRQKRELAARELAAKEQAALQKKLEDEQNEAKRRELEEQQAKLKAEEEARQKAEAERVAAQKVASAAPATTPSSGPVAQKTPAQCRIHVSQLSDSGTLTYEDAKRVRGAVVEADTGIIRLPPVTVPGGRPAVFEVMPDGCARIARR